MVKMWKCSCDLCTVTCVHQFDLNSLQGLLKNTITLYPFYIRVNDNQKNLIKVTFRASLKFPIKQEVNYIIRHGE